MFLLIHDQRNGSTCRIQHFKFHYVSINSNLSRKVHISGQTLNSIMFLLILHMLLFFFQHILTLNSIMFLLILSLLPFLCIHENTLNSIMFLLIPVPKPTAYLLHEIPLFCRPLQNISFLSHSSSYVLATPPILAIFYFCRFPAFFTLSQVDRNHYIFIISSFLLA